MTVFFSVGIGSLSNREKEQTDASQEVKRKEDIMKLNDFLKPELLGNRFFAVKGYTEVLDRETSKPTAFRLNVSIQDENSDFFMEMIQVKVNTLTPTLTVQEMANNKTCPVILKDLNVGQFNGNLWFSCSDILPVAK